jgi:1-acyl-sn-glycerol-3-phosphate acyltransferase
MSTDGPQRDLAKTFFNRWLRFGYWLLLRLEVEGVDNVPRAGPVILMINHINFLDPFVIVASMPRQVTAMSKLENFSIPFWGLVFKLYGAIPVRRGEVDRRALRQALEVLKRGDTMLLIAPEGTRSPNRALQKAHSGLSFIGHRSKASIVPVAITGTARFSRNIKRLKRTPAHVKVGKPFQFRVQARRMERQLMSTMTNEAMYQLAALLPPDYRGVYSDLEQATEDFIEFPDGSGTNLPFPRTHRGSQSAPARSPAPDSLRRAPHIAQVSSLSQDAGSPESAAE